MLHEKMNLRSVIGGVGKKYMPDEYFDLKSRIHDRLLDLIDLSIIDKLEREALIVQIRKVIERILREEQFKLPLNMGEREKILSEIVDEVLGYGPLEPLLKDPTVSDILVNTYKSIYVERRGILEPTDARFKDDAHLMHIIDKIVSQRGAAHRRVLAHGGRPPAGRLPRQRHHPAAGRGRPMRFHPAFCRKPARVEDLMRSGRSPPRLRNCSRASSRPD